MARRRSTFSSDSLELLLDTICNVFGGIILMAILVVLLTQTTAGRLPEPESEDVERAFRVQRLRFERQKLQRRLADLQAHRRQIGETFQDTTSEAGERLADARSRFQEAVQEASERVQQMNTTVKDTRREHTRAEEQLAEAERHLDEKQEDLDRLQADLRHAESAVSRKVRLPHRRGAASGSPRYYVVQGHRAYELKNVRWFAGTHEAGQCSVTADRERRVAFVRPVPGEGYPAPVDGASVGAFRAALMRHPPASHYLVFFVYDDSASYAAFQALKDVAVDAGFAYMAEPVVTEDGAFPIVPTSHHETE
ncbi:MAG: hypothetical protein R6X20_12600 [Phycisphaerae bacterium]